MYALLSLTLSFSLSLFDRQGKRKKIIKSPERGAEKKGALQLSPRPCRCYQRNMAIVISTLRKKKHGGKKNVSWETRWLPSFVWWVPNWIFASYPPPSTKKNNFLLKISKTCRVPLDVFHVQIRFEELEEVSPSVQWNSIQYSTLSWDFTGSNQIPHTWVTSWYLPR